MAEYHIGCGIAGIYAGTVKPNGFEWRNKSLVTDEAIDAVRDYLTRDIDDNKGGQNGYEWTKKNGDKVKLIATLEKQRVEQA